MYLGVFFVVVRRKILPTGPVQSAGRLGNWSEKIKACRGIHINMTLTPEQLHRPPPTRMEETAECVELETLSLVGMGLWTEFHSGVLSRM